MDRGEFVTKAENTDGGELTMCIERIRSDPDLPLGHPSKAADGPSADMRDGIA